MTPNYLDKPLMSIIFQNVCFSLGPVTPSAFISPTLDSRMWQQILTMNYSKGQVGVWIGAGGSCKDLHAILIGNLPPT